MNQKLAYNDGPRRNANAGLKRRAGVRPEFRYCIDQGESGAHCLLRVVFLRARIAEI